MQKRGLGKKAQGDSSHHVLIVLFEMIILAAILVSFLSYARSLEKDLLLQKTYLSKDLSLLTSTIFSSPGTVKYVYVHPKVDISRFSFDFSGNKVSVAELEDVDGKPWYGMQIFYPYGYDENIRFQSTVLNNPPAILFDLSEKSLQIASSAIEESLICPEVDTKSDGKNIAVDPGHGEDSRLSSDTYGLGRGSSNDLKNKKEEDISLGISNSLSYQLQQDGFVVVLTRDQESYVSIADRQGKLASSDVVISIHTGDDKSSYNGVVAYVYSESSNYLKSEKLACLILKEFVGKFPELKRAVITRVSKDDFAILEAPINILENEKVAVQLEISNIQLDKSLLDSPSPDISTPIRDAIKKYYE